MRTVIVIIIVVVVIFLGYVVYWLNIENSEFSPIIVDDIIVFEKIDKKIFVRAVSWGMASSHNKVVFSSKPFTLKSIEHDPEDFVFHTSELFFKKESSNTVLVYTTGSSIGELPNSSLNGIKIIPIELKTYDEIEKIKKEYLQKGLKRISSYQSTL